MQTVDGATPPHPWDIAIVGAGPAGATAALAAVRASKRVIVLERSTIPRYKTCGGELIGTSLRGIPAGVHVPVRGQVGTFTFALNGRMRRTRRSADSPLMLIRRDELDEALIRAAVEAGAIVRDHSTVARITQTADYVDLATVDGSHVLARIVIGADGTAGRTSTHVGARYRQVDLGLEVELPLPQDMRATWDGRVLIDWGKIAGGYAWVFPKGDSLSVGVIAARGHGAATRAYLADFLVAHGLSQLPPIVSSGHLTRCRTPDSPLFRGRVLLAGDAAGLLEPWTREGISFALRSGTLAGSAAVAAVDTSSAQGVQSAMASYASVVTSTFDAEIHAGWLLAAAFRKRAWPFHFAIATFPPAWTFFLRFVSGEHSFAAALAHPLVRLALRLLRR